MTVVLLDARRPTMVPLEALAPLSGRVEYTEEVPVRVRWLLPDARGAGERPEAPTLLTSDRDHPAARARVDAGERVVAAAAVPGEALLDAVAVMDRLRAGSWEAAQTHDSLRRYLLEETYELLDAVDSGSRVELREELGDLLLQVLFHARIAADAETGAFTIDDVARTLVEKLNNRAPRLVDEDGSLLDEDTRNRMWEERKAAEKPRRSCLDGVAFGQPALALTQKVLSRARSAGLPDDLVPEALVRVTIDMDPEAPSAEDGLRRETLAFAERVRTVERASGGRELNAATWRSLWPGVL